MTKYQKLIRSINSFVEKVQKNEFEDIPEFEGKEFVPTLVEEYESAISSAFRKERKRLIEFMNEHWNDVVGVTKATDFDVLRFIREFLGLTPEGRFISPAFTQEIYQINRIMYTRAIERVSAATYKVIEPGVNYLGLTERALDYVEEWSKDLADIMSLSTENHIKNALTDGLKKGEGIQQIELRLVESDDFSRKRARTTAKTEILAASNSGLMDAYLQSPSVGQKKWRHSGIRNRRQPRTNHMAMDGTTINVDEEFEIIGSGEKCMQPGDIHLPPGERINCGCIISPEVDREIASESVEERRKRRDEIRNQVREETRLERERLKEEMEQKIRDGEV